MKCNKNTEFYFGLLTELYLVKPGYKMVLELSFYPIYQPLRSGRIWHKVNF